MAERAGLFEEDLDLSQFTPHKPAKSEQPRPEAVWAVAEGAKFQSREPAKPAKPRQQRRYRTGRNIQLNTKVTVSTRDGFYEDLRTATTGCSVKRLKGRCRLSGANLKRKAHPGRLGVSR